MNYRLREGIFNFIMVRVRRILYLTLHLNKHKKYEKDIDKEGFIPILSYNPKMKYYRFNCYCFDCPCNFEGLCSTHFNKIPIECLHEFDGDNVIKNYCG